MPEDYVPKLQKLLENSMRKSIPKGNYGILFSGGIDSTLLALLSKKLNRKPALYTSCLDFPGFKSRDFEAARKVAKYLQLPLRVQKITLENIEPYLKKVISVIKTTDVVDVGVALTVYAAAELARRDRIKVMLAGSGNDELFAGYFRLQTSKHLNRDCYSAFLKMQKTDLPRDRATLKANKITLKTPYTAKPVVDFALKLPSGQKISKTQTKIIIRELAKSLGLPTELAERKKCAAQYGSGFDKAIKKLAKKSGYKSRSKYLYQFRKKPNLKLAALFSSGKDSTYAMQIVTNQNYEISCIVTIHSSNPDSYMYHTPNIEFATLQAKAMQKPIIIKKTPGKKEKELRELELALKEAIKKYKIKGVVCGAIHSTYQRDRIQKICEKLNLRLFAPLWQKTQENEIRECITAGIKFIPVKISAHGLDKTWLGRETTHSDVDKLVALDKKFGFNIAFEGGEAETFVLDSPLFKKRIKITDSEITEESENNASLIIKKAELAEK